MRLTINELNKIGYSINQAGIAVKLHQGGQRNKRASLGCPSGTPAEGQRRGRKMVRQQYRVLLTLEEYAIQPKDPSALGVAAKYVIDGLVDNWLLEDDSYRHVEVVSRGIKVGGKEEERLEVKLEIINKQ